MEKTPLNVIQDHKENLNIVYNKQGQIRVIYEDDRVTDLPDELQGLNPDEIPEKLSNLRDRLLKKEDEVMEEDEEYEEEDEVELSGDAINNVRVLVTEKINIIPEV